MNAILAGGSAAAVLMILAKATLVLLAAIAVTRGLERASAISRHLVWFVSLGALLLIPALASWSPLRLAILPPAPAVATDAPAAPSVAPGISAVPVVAATPAEAGIGVASAPAIASRGSTTAVNVDATVRTVRDIVSPKTPLFGLLSDPVVLMAIWATVAIMFACWLAWGALSVRRIINRSRPLESPEWLNPLWEVADRIGLEHAPRLVRSDDAKMPFACGLMRPTIVLPAECDGWTLDRRRAVLLHELAHVRRRDLIGHTVGRFACALYWFHPLVWTAAKRLRAESERACDDLALTCGARASDYAEHLLDIVTGVRHHATPAVALAMARRKEFEGRMLAILDPELRRGAPSRAQTLGLVGGLAVLSLVVGAAVPVARAADAAGRPVAARAPRPMADTERFLDEEMSQAVRTVERTRTSQQISTRTDTIRRRDEDPASIGSTVGSALGSQIGKSVGTAVGEIVGGAVSASVAASVPSIESIMRSVQESTKQQGRANDERPALLANVLRSDTSAALRRVAAWGLSQFADADVAADALAKAVRGDRDERVREMAAWALADAHSSTDVIDALTTALRRDASVKVRATAAWALGNLGDRDAVDALAQALSDTSRAVRVRAIWAIGNAEPRQAPRQLIAGLSDPDKDVREMTAWALFNIEDPEAVPAIDAAMQREKDPDTQRALIRALAATGERSVDAIKRLIDSNDPEVRSIAIRALAGGGGVGPWPKPWPQPRPQP